jgi:hypothetical protein
LLRDLVPDVTLSLFLMPPEVPLSMFALLPIPLLFRYMSFLFRQKVDSLSLSQTVAPVSEQQSLFTGQILLFFSCLALLFRFLGFWQRAERGLFPALLIVHCAHGVVDVAQDLFKFVVVAADGDSGNSLAAFRVIFVANLVFLLFHFVTIIAFLAWAILHKSYMLFCLLELYSVGADIWQRIVTAYRGVHLGRVIMARLARPTAEELAEERLCVVCRTELTPANARTLPCGHTIHGDCLERWLGEKGTCPMCQRDLSVVLERAAAPPEPEGEPEPMDAEKTGEGIQRRTERVLTELAGLHGEIEAILTEVAGDE